MDSKTPDNSGDLFGDLAEPALLTSKISGKFRWTATKTRNKSLRACKNSGKFGIVLKKLGQVPGSPSISSPRILFFGFSLAGKSASALLIVAAIFSLLICQRGQRACRETEAVTFRSSVLLLQVPCHPDNSRRNN